MHGYRVVAETQSNSFCLSRNLEDNEATIDARVGAEPTETGCRWPFAAVPESASPIQLTLLKESATELTTLPHLSR